VDKDNKSLHDVHAKEQIEKPEAVLAVIKKLYWKCKRSRQGKVFDLANYDTDKCS
jgi:hypothetical protein